MKSRLRALALVAAVSGAALALASGGFTFAAFTSQADNPANRVTAADDFRAPTVSASVIGKTSGGTPGYVKQGGSYYVYANVSDTGNPASGIASVSADVSAITTGQTAVPLSAGSYSADGVSYNYRSASLTAANPLSAGSKSYTVSSTDNAANAGTQNGFSVIVDNTAPFASDIQTADGGSNTGLAQAGDTITFTFSEPVEPSSILAGWNGASTPVVVRLINRGLLGLGTDEQEIWNAADSAQLPIGTLNLARLDYVGGLLGGEIARFGATGTASTMVMSGSGVTITLGTHSGQAATDGSGTGTMGWPTTTSVRDRADNSATTGSASESGAADREF